MASINDIGVAGQPLDSPPLTAWQAAVRDALTPILGVLTPRAGWADYGGTYAGLMVTKQRQLVTINAALKPTADTPVSTATGINVADLPSTFLPAAYVSSAGTINLVAGGVTSGCRIVVTTAGVLTIVPGVSGTITAAGGIIAVSITYRAGAV
jgi:hypothetical protein